MTKETQMLSQRLNVCKICGKQFGTPKAVYGHMWIHSRKSSLSENLHVCKICGIKFAKSISLCNHLRIHFGKRDRMVGEDEIQCLLRICGFYSETESSSSYSMTEIEEHEMNEAAMSLVMFSQQVYIRNSPPFPPSPPGDTSMDLEVKPMQESILHCVESKLDFSEQISHSNTSTCSDVVVHVLPSPMTSKLQKKQQSNVSYKFKICGKSFRCSQALGGHQTLHRSVEDSEGDNLLSDSLEAKKMASQLLSLEVTPEELTQLRDTNVKEHCVELKEDFCELFPHEETSTCSDVVVQAVHSPLRSKPESNSSRKCKICGKIFGCYRALGGHQGLHRSIRGQLAHKRVDFEGGNSLSDSLEAKKIVSEPSSFDISQEESIELRDTNVKEQCVELKQDFSELSSHSGFKKSGSCSDVVAQELHSPLRSKLQQKPRSNKCKICGKILGSYQALGGHQRLHRSILARKREDFEGGNSLSGLSEAKKIVSEPSSFEASQEKLIELRDTNVKEQCVESKQDFSELFSHSGFEKSSSCSDVVAQALSSPLRCKLQEQPQSNSTYKCKICGKILGCSQALAGHQNLHKSIRGKIARKREDFEGGNSLSGLSESKKIFSEPSSFEVSQEKLLELRDTNVKEQCAESKQDFSELFSHSGLEKSSDVVAQALPSLLRCKLHEKPESNSSLKCSKTFGCYEALGGHQTLHRSTFGCKRMIFEDGNPRSEAPEAKKIFSQLSGFEVYQD